MLQSVVQPLVRRVTDKGSKTLIQRAIASLRARGTDAHLWLPGVGTVSGLTTGNYLESTGSTLGTVDNPCGLVLDALGSVGVELFSDFAVEQSPWVQSGASWSVNGSQAGNADIKIDPWSITLGKTYKFTFTVSGASSSLIFYLGKETTVTYGNGTHTAHVSATANYFYVRAAAGVSATIDNISVREVSGIHLTQGTTANKPVLRRGAYNLVKYSESLETTSGFWQATNCTKTDGVLDPDGGMTAHTLTATADGGSYLNAYAFGVKGCNGAWIRRRSGVGAVQGFNGGAYIPWPGLTTEWQRITIQNINTSTQYVMFKFATAGDSVDVWRPQGVDGSVLGDYSPTTTAAASNPDAGKYSWAFDGSNDSLLTGNLGITNACTIVIAGRLDSLGVTTFLMCEDSGGIVFYVTTAGVVSFDNYGGASLVASSAGQIVAGTPFVLTVRLSGGVAVIRKNGVQVATATTATVFTATTGAQIAASFGGSSNRVTGSLGNVLALPVALTDAECLLVERMAAANFHNGPVF